MAWPFSSVAAPNLDPGFVAIPTVLGAVAGLGAGTNAWLIGAQFSNGTSDVLTVTVEDGAGNIIINALAIGPGDTVTLEWAFMPTVGLQWVASAAGLVGKLWGYQ